MLNTLIRPISVVSVYACGANSQLAMGNDAMKKFEEAAIQPYMIGMEKVNVVFGPKPEHKL